MELPVAFGFSVDYTRSRNHLVARWLLLCGFASGFGLLTYVAQRRKDVV